MAAVEMTAHEDAQAGTGAAAALLVDLQDDVIQHDRVVAADNAFLLVTEDLIQVQGAERDEGTGGIGRRAPEGLIEVGDEALGKVAIGGGDGPDARELEFIDEPALHGAVRALAAP